MRRGPGGGPLRPSASPLTLSLAPRGRASIQEARDWLKTISPKASQRFITVLGQETHALCKAVAVNPPTQLNEAATLYFGRPTFSHRFQTSKTRQKRSASGVWYIFYDLEDTDNDGRPDILRVLLVYHAARPPLWEEPREDEDDEPSEAT